jgi:HK97 family phage prohead protease
MIRKFFTDCEVQTKDFIRDIIREDVDQDNKSIERAVFDRVREEGIEITYRITSSNEDRHGDTINAKGWRFDNFFSAGANLLFAHDTASHDTPSIGVVREVWNDGDFVFAKVWIFPEHVDAQANRIARIVAAGGLRAVSVGFMPIKAKASDKNEDGIDFIEQELLELSIVPVPANADAVADDAKSLRKSLRKKGEKMSEENEKEEEVVETAEAIDTTEIKSEEEIAELSIKIENLESMVSSLSEKVAVIEESLAFLFENDEPEKQEEEEEEEEKNLDELTDVEIEQFIDSLGEEEKAELLKALNASKGKK